jgi:hypothetical protein
VVLTATLGVTDTQSEQGSEVGPAGHDARDGDPEKSGNRRTPRRWRVNDRRATGVERRYGWLGGRGSEGWKAYGRMQRETKLPGLGGIKPLRG